MPLTKKKERYYNIYIMMEEDPLLVSRRRPFSSRVNLRRAESAEEVVEFEESYQNIEAGTKK